MDHCKVKYKCGLGSLLNLLPFPRGYMFGTLVFPSNTSKLIFSLNQLDVVLQMQLPYKRAIDVHYLNQMFLLELLIM